MNIIRIEDNQIKKYKKDEYLEKGEYILAKNPTNEQKKIFPFIASEYGGFRWLLPVKSWILQELTGNKVIYRLEEKIEIKYLEEFINDGKIPFWPWQKRFLRDVLETVKMGESFRKGLIVGLGGGKTLATITLQWLGKMIYVCPKHLKGTIIDECRLWDLPVPDITTPESVHKLSSNKYTVGIVDESLLVKNPGAKRTKKVREMFENIPIVIAMTGTPFSAKKAPDARWLNVLDGLVPNLEKNWIWRFGIEPYYLDLAKLGARVPMREDGTFPKPLKTDEYDVQKISRFLGDSVSVVDISEIMKNIPEKTYKTVSLKRPRFYLAVLKGLFTKKASSKIVSQARSATSNFCYTDDHSIMWHQKTSPKIEWIKDFLTENPEEPVVIFSNWPPEQDRLQIELEKYNPAMVTSSQKQVEKFTSGQTNVMICSSNISEGMNLQRSRVGIFCSNTSRPDKREQAEGRLYRSGQKRGVVFIDLVCNGTLDGKQLELLKEYQGVNEKFIEAKLLEELERMQRGKR